MIARIRGIIARMARLFRPAPLEDPQWPKHVLTTLESQHKKPLVLNTIPRLRGTL